MQRPLFVLVLVLGLLANGFAQDPVPCDGEPDCLGIYFDDGTWDENCIEPMIAVPFTMYWVLKDVSAAEIGGFDFGWRPDPEFGPEIFILQTSLPPGCGLFEDYSVQCILATPIPVSGPMLLMSVAMLPIAPELAYDLYLGPSADPMVPGQAVYLDGAHDPVPLTFAVPVDDEGWSDGPVAKLGDCAVATAPTTWGRMKALYHVGP